MDAATRMSLVLAAVNAAGPANGDPNYVFAVADKAAQIMNMTQDGSPVAELLSQMEQVKPFVATVLSVRREMPSTRGVLTFKAAKTTKPDKVNKDAISGEDLAPGVEQARTQRTDAPMGAGLAKKLQSLTGYEVLLYIGHEQFVKNGDTLKMRVVLHAEPIGLSDDPEAQAAKAAYDARMLAKAAA